MKEIKRSELPKKCPDCGADLKSYHEANPMITRRVCSKNCNGFRIVATIIHSSDKCFIHYENKKAT